MYSARDKEINIHERDAAAFCGYASDCWRLRTSYEENSQAEQWSRNVAVLVQINRSLRGKREEIEPVSLCLSPYRLTYFRSARIQWQVMLAGCSPAATLYRLQQFRFQILWFNALWIFLLNLHRTPRLLIALCVKNNLNNFHIIMYMYIHI